MRPYPTDSPQAAARIVALTMLADGHLCKRELDVLKRLRLDERLGLDPAEWRAVLHGFCEDLLASADAAAAHTCSVDPHTLASLLGEIVDPALRRTVLRLCLAVVESDEHVSDGEWTVVSAAVEQWGLEHEMLRAGRAEREVQP